MKKEKKIKIEKEIFPIHFVCGMSRAGTTWMSHCLNMHKQCASFGETLFWGRIYIEPETNGLYDDKSFQTLVDRISEIKLDSEPSDFGQLKSKTIKGWSQDMPKALLALECKIPVNLFKAMCQFVLVSEGKTVAIEKTPHHVNWLPRITSALPDSRFIIMVRDPYGFMKSYKFQGYQSGADVRAIFEKQYHPIQAALVWRGYAKSIISSSISYSEKVKIVRNEDLIKQPKQVLLDVADFLDLPLDDKFAEEVPPRTNSSVMGNKTLELDSTDLFWLNLIAKKEIQNLGYDIKTLKIDFFKVIYTILKLPLWFCRTVILLKDNSRGNVFKYVMRWLK